MSLGEAAAHGRGIPLDGQIGREWSKNPRMLLTATESRGPELRACWTEVGLCTRLVGQDRTLAKAVGENGKLFLLV